MLGSMLCMLRREVYLKELGRGGVNGVEGEEGRGGEGRIGRQLKQLICLSW